MRDTDSMDTLREHYEKFRERGKILKKHGYDYENERAFIIETVHPIEGKIIEIGTGKGGFTIALAQAGYHVTSVDISEEEQVAARMNISYLALSPYVEFVVSNAESLNIPDKSYRNAFAVNVMHHLENPFTVLDEMIRIVADNGRIVLSDFNERGFEAIRYMHISEGREHDVSPHSLCDVKKYADQKGFMTQWFESACHEMVIIHKGKEYYDYINRQR